jgi:hypothetical protein
LQKQKAADAAEDEQEKNADCRCHKPARRRREALSLIAHGCCTPVVLYTHRA